MKKMCTLLLSLAMILGLCLPINAKEDMTPEEKAAIELVEKMAKYAEEEDYDRFEELFYKADDEVIDGYYDQDFSFLEGAKVAAKLMAKKGKISVVGVTYYDNSNAMAPQFISDTIVMVKRGSKYYMDYRNSSIRRLKKELIKQGVFPKLWLAPETDNIIHLDENNYMYAYKDFYMDDCVYAQPAYMCQKENGDVEMQVWVNNGMSSDAHYITAEIVCVDKDLGEVVNDIFNVDITAKKESSTCATIIIPAEKVKTGREQWIYMDTSIVLRSASEEV